jgi:putative chitinase
MITIEQLQKIGIDAKWLQPLNETFDKFDINTPERMASFIGQCMLESGNFNHLEENLNYSAVRITQVWSRISLAKAQDAVTKGKPAIAELIYGHRTDLGNTKDGDGGLFFGRGIIQLTGRANYGKFSQFCGEDCVANPELVATKYPMMSAAYFFDSNKLWAICDKGDTVEDVKAVTKRVNGGYNGLDDRQKYFTKFWALLK